MMTLLTLLLVVPAVLIPSAVESILPAGQVYSLYRRGKLVRVLQAGTPSGLADAGSGRARGSTWPAEPCVSRSRSGR